MIMHSADQVQSEAMEHGAMTYAIALIDVLNKSQAQADPPVMQCSAVLLRTTARKAGNQVSVW